MNTEEKLEFLHELTLNLQHKGLTVKQEAGDDRLTVELDGHCHTGEIGKEAVCELSVQDHDGAGQHHLLEQRPDILRCVRYPAPSSVPG